jgi:transposase InsO family protein
MSISEQRAAFVADYRRDLWSMTELCARYAVARKTGYKWVARHEAEGRGGLEDRSRCPRTQPTAVSSAVTAAIVAMRQQHPRWGPRKLRARLQRQDPTAVWPARSTVAKILHRAGLVDPVGRRVRPTASPHRGPLIATGPNDIWTTDFKGQFKTGDGRYCYPLTVLDRFSRFALDCYGLAAPTANDTRRRFLRLFHTYGLPAVLRSDNGTPFASTGLAGLSRLAVWWLRLGIQLDRITPGHPQENGSHERFHRTLKAETACPPAATVRQQQARFDAHRREYNEERPHEALNDQPPATHYRPSSRPMPTRLVAPDYPRHWEIRRVGSNGCIAWHSTVVFLTSALESEDVGFEPIDDGLWVIYLAAQALGRFDERTCTVLPTQERLRPSLGPKA